MEDEVTAICRIVAVDDEMWTAGAVRFGETHPILSKPYFCFTHFRILQYCV